MSRLLFFFIALVGCGSSDEPAKANASPEAGACDFTGTFTFSGATASSDGGSCDLAAKQYGTENSEATADVSYARNASGQWEASNGRDAPAVYALDAAACTLSTQASANVQGSDADHRPVMLKVTNTLVVAHAGDNLTATQTVVYAPETPGVKGYPCTLTVKQEGVRKK